MSYLTLAKYVGGLAALIGMVIFLAYVRQLHAEHVRYGQCVAASAGKPGAKPVASVCDPPIAAAVVAAGQAAACDAQLGSLMKAGTPGAPAVCSVPVRGVVAQRDAGADTIASQAHALDEARSDQTAAVARAAVRATSDAERKAHAASVFAAAPRDSDGLARCDADCLRNAGR